jgi:RNA polymerase-associated protein LEO1
VRRESKQKRVRERGTTRGLSAAYLEPDHEDGSDDENAISLAAIKKKYKQDAKSGGKGVHLLSTFKIASKPFLFTERQNIYSSDDDDSDIETRKAAKGSKTKALRESDDDEEGGESVASASGGSNDSGSD